jgi:hypothetical protein
LKIIKKNFFRGGAAFLFFALAASALHILAGTYGSECGRFGDEGMHFVTSLFLKDFLLSGQWSQPMQFARDFYLHFPKVGLGNWPPLFPSLNALWMIVWGDSRLGLLLLGTLYTALLSWLCWREVREEGLPAWLAGLLLIASPATQYQTSMVMAELLLAVLTWISFRLLLSYLESGRPLFALGFGLFAMLTIMTKGNGWVLALAAPVTILFTGHWRRLLDKWLWLGIALIAAICVPYTLWSMKMVVQGWDSQSVPDTGRLWFSLRLHWLYAIQILGWPLSMVALAGVWDTVLRPCWQRRKPEVFWLGMFVLGLSIMAFHIAVPTSIEPRKIYQIAPVVCVFLVAGLRFASRSLGAKLPAPDLTLCAIALAWFVWTPFRLQEPWNPGFRPAIETILARQDTRNSAILVSSNPFMQDQEAGIIATWAELSRRDGVYLVRATKLLLGLPYNDLRNGFELPSRYQTSTEVQAALADVPITYTFLHSTPYPRDYLHNDLLLQTVRSHPEHWQPVYQSQTMIAGQPHSIEVFRTQDNHAGKPVRINIDLSGRIGEKLNTPN